MPMLGAKTMLLVVAFILAALALRGYAANRRLESRHKTWLIVAGIFVAVTVGLALVEGTLLGS
jgi:pheromone shutdown protein TraB